MFRPALIALIPMLALAGCISAPLDPKLEASAAYQTGYGDGCSTSTARSRVYDQTLIRNETSYAEDELYKRGWNMGYRSCGGPMTRKDPYAEPVGTWQTHGPLN